MGAAAKWYDVSTDDRPNREGFLQANRHRASLYPVAVHLFVGNKFEGRPKETPELLTEKLRG